MTDESKKDRFEELWDKVFYNYENMADITIDQMNEMLDIYHALQKENEKLKKDLKEKESSNAIKSGFVDYPYY